MRVKWVVFFSFLSHFCHWKKNTFRFFVCERVRYGAFKMCAQLSVEIFLAQPSAPCWSNAKSKLTWEHVPQRAHAVVCGCVCEYANTCMVLCCVRVYKITVKSYLHSYNLYYTNGINRWIPGTHSLKWLRFSISRLFMHYISRYLIVIKIWEQTQYATGKLYQGNCFCMNREYNCVVSFIYLSCILYLLCV